MSALTDLFEELDHLEYLQGYDFVEGAEGDGKSPFYLVPRDRTLRKVSNLLKLLPMDMSGTSILDIGCNKGFFSLESIRRGAERVLGIDLYARQIEVLQRIASASPLLKGLAFECRPFNEHVVNRGPFDIVFCLSVYHYLYADMHSHDRIFSLLAKACSKRLILELPLEPDDRFALKTLSKSCSGEVLAAYNCHAILQSASRHFGSVRYIANSVALRTRDIFLLEKPGDTEEFDWEWKERENPWRVVRPDIAKKD